MAFFMEVREHPPVAQTTLLTVIAQDPSIRDGAKILTEQVGVPAEVTEPGPRGARFHVVDYDAALGTLVPALRLAVPDAFEKASNAALLGQAFRAQNVYAIAARTLATFESALGRRLKWAFNGHQLFLVPRAFPELNAYYSPEDGAILFGYLPTREGELQTCLSHDVIAHETTHAVLDGLRPRATPSRDFPINPPSTRRWETSWRCCRCSRWRRWSRACSARPTPRGASPDSA